MNTILSNDTLKITLGDIPVTKMSFILRRTREMGSIYVMKEQQPKPKYVLTGMIETNNNQLQEKCEYELNVGNKKINVELLEKTNNMVTWICNDDPKETFEFLRFHCKN